MAWLVFTRADAPRFAKLLNWLFGLPVRGTHHGGGVHVDMPDTVPDPCPRDVLGWTTRHRPWVARPDNTGAAGDEFAVRLTPEIQAAWQAKRGLLSASQRQWVQDHVDVAKDVEAIAEWKRNITNPEGGTTKAVVEADDVEPEK